MKKHNYYLAREWAPYLTVGWKAEQKHQIAFKGRSDERNPVKSLYEIRVNYALGVGLSYNSFTSVILGYVNFAVNQLKLFDCILWYEHIFLWFNYYEFFCCEISINENQSYN